MDEEAQDVKTDHPNIKLVSAKRYHTPCTSDFPLESHYISFIASNAFFAEVCRHVKRVFTRDIPTAGVSFNRQEDGFVLYVNPDYVKGLTGAQLAGLLHHELYHIVFNHVAMGLKPHKLWNIAQDMHINSILKKSAGDDSRNIALHGSWIVPGVRATKPDGTAFTDEELEQYPLVKFVEKMPLGCSSAQYFHALIQEGMDKHVPEDIEVYVGFDMDSHDGEGLGQEADDYITARGRAILERATKQADATGSWGNIPQDMRTAIRSYVNKSVDWKSVLRQFIGYLNRGSKRTSMKKINKRFPYVHPGTQRSTVARLLIAIDESGSVDNGMLDLFYATLTDLASHVEIDILPFDCTVNEPEFFTWKRGTRPHLERTRGGGTNFDAPTQFVNDPRNRGRWDALLIVTDGEAPAPGPCNIRRAWCYPEDRKLMFDTSETKIVVSQGKGLIDKVA
jgi:predicted metal-dependent peptidase